MLKKEIKKIISDYIKELKKEGINAEKVILYGSYAKGKEREDSDIDLALVYNLQESDSIEENIKLWKIAVRVDCRIAPVYLSVMDFKNTFIPIVYEINKGIDLSNLAA